MAGVRGFNDPNVQVNKDGSPVWFQLVANKPFSVELVAWNSNGTGLAWQTGRPRHVYCHHNLTPLVPWIPRWEFPQCNSVHDSR